MLSWKTPDHPLYLIGHDEVTYPSLNQSLIRTMEFPKWTETDKNLPILITKKGREC